jgi:hypothetical protein
MPGEAYLRYIGLPDWYPGWNALACDISETMLEAAEQVLADQQKDDPIARALMDEERPQPWIWTDVCVDHLQPGTRIAVNDWEGTIRAAHPDDAWRLYPDQIPTDLQPTTAAEWRQLAPTVRRGQVVAAYVPVPVAFT